MLQRNAKSRYSEEQAFRIIFYFYTAFYTARKIILSYDIVLFHIGNEVCVLSILQALHKYHDSTNKREFQLGIFGNRTLIDTPSF